MTDERKSIMDGLRAQHPESERILTWEQGRELFNAGIQSALRSVGHCEHCREHLTDGECLRCKKFSEVIERLSKLTGNRSRL